MYHELTVAVLVCILIIGFVIMLGLGTNSENVMISAALLVAVIALFIAVKFYINEEDTSIVQEITDLKQFR